MKKKYVFLSIIIILIFVVSVIGVNIHNDKVFSQEKWNSNIWERNKMIDNLTQTYDLYQMSSNDIVDLLGTNGLVENSHFTYYVGKEYSGPVLFSITFDENDYVSGYGIIID